jgi:CHAT domain-containing protein
MKKIIFLLTFFIFSCFSEKENNSQFSDKIFINNYKNIEKIYEEFKSKKYQEDGTYKFNSFEYFELKTTYYQIFDLINTIKSKTNENNLEWVYDNILDKSYFYLIEVGSLLYDPSNDYSIDYTNWYDDYDLIFNELFLLSSKINLSRELVGQIVDHVPTTSQWWIELVLNDYSFVEDIINDLKNNKTTFYTTLYYYVLSDFNYNIVVGDLADTYNEIYRTAKSSNFNLNVNFNYELEFMGFIVNSAASGHYSTTSDFENSNFYLLKSIDYLNSINFSDLSDDNFEISGENKKLIVLDQVHRSLYDLFFDSILPNSSNIAQNSNDYIWIDSIEKYFKKIKILEELHNVSSQVPIPPEYIEENEDGELLIRNNIIFLSRVINTYKSHISESYNVNEGYSDSGYSKMTNDLTEVGNLVGIYNRFSDNDQRGYDWYADAMEDIYNISSDYNDEKITVDYYFEKMCSAYKTNLDIIFENVTINDIQTNPEAYFDHFSFLKDAINMKCSDEIINNIFETVGVPYQESVWMHDLLLIDRINEVYTIDDDKDRLFLDYLYADSIINTKNLSTFFNNFYKSNNANFIIYNIAEKRNNLVESGSIYLITRAENIVGNNFEIYSYAINDNNDIENLLYDFATFKELIKFKADIKIKSSELHDLLIREEFEEVHQKGVFNLFVLDPSLHNLPLEILVDNDNKYLFETTDIIRAHTLTDFINDAYNFTQKMNSREQRMDNFQRLIGATKNVIDPTILAFGDINFNIENRKIERITRNNLGSLPYTLNEVKSIDKIVRQSKILTGKSATETNFKKFSRDNYSIIHFATHGLSFYNNFKNSSIILTNDRENDGLLTYSEISQANLKGVDLVFLSACNTNLARNFRNISSPSIQQAFKSAGANTVISSMWPINDLSTSLFVEIYYNEYMKTGLSFKALQNTRKIFIETYPEYNHPYYWAAFTQFGI